MKNQRKRFINNDLFVPVLTDANIFHFVISAILSLSLGFWWAWLIGILWEVGDGFKPWYSDAPPHIRLATLRFAWKKRSWRMLRNWIKKELFYSDKFSLQDVFIWDLGGCVIGGILRWVMIM